MAVTVSYTPLWVDERRRLTTFLKYCSQEVSCAWNPRGVIVYINHHEWKQKGHLANTW